MVKTLLTAYLIVSLNLPLNAADTTPNFKAPEFKPQTILHPAPVPVKKSSKIAPVIEAEIALALDINSGTLLYEKNIHQEAQIASLTKLMTAILVLEENELDEIVTISENAAETPGSKIWLFPGEKISVENLLAAVIIASANDAAVALAEHNAGSETEFVKKMNQRTTQLGLKNTHFANSVGFDHPENYSTASDLTTLSLKALKFPFFREHARLSHLSVSSTHGQKHTLEATNEILGGFLNIIGLKTGRTAGAGACLITLAEGPDSKSSSNDSNEESPLIETAAAKTSIKRPILTIVLDSPSRFRESKFLTNWIYDSYLW